MHDTTRTFLVANLAAWRLATDDGIARSFHASNFPAKYITSALVWRHTLAQTRHILILETGNWKECCIVIEVKKVLAIPASFRQIIVIVNLFEEIFIRFHFSFSTKQDHCVRMWGSKVLGLFVVVGTLYRGAANIEVNTLLPLHPRTLPPPCPNTSNKWVWKNFPTFF